MSNNTLNKNIRVDNILKQMDVIEKKKLNPLSLKTADNGAFERILS